MRFYQFLIAIISLWSCKTSEYILTPQLQLSEDQKILFLDSTNAAAAIVSDTSEFFFEKINKLDMSIQLNRKLNPLQDRANLLEEYKNDLREDVLNFTPEEIDFIKKIFQEVFSECVVFSKNIFPDEIKLIKIRGSHYGEGTFYTRENCIIIPKSDLLNPDDQSFKKVMLHELFHIYSRFNPQKKLKLYELVGFKNMVETHQLEIPKDLKDKMLLNPDGINYAYSIKLHGENDTTFEALPIIFSNEADFDENNPEFFSYLQFELFKVIPSLDKKAKVISKSDGKSTIDFKNHPEFFKQISDNTNYIIHPDEILAENFVIAIQSQGDTSKLENLSDSGKKLIKKLVKVISD